MYKILTEFKKIKKEEDKKKKEEKSKKNKKKEELKYKVRKIRIENLQKIRKYVEHIIFLFCYFYLYHNIDFIMSKCPTFIMSKILNVYKLCYYTYITIHTLHTLQ